MMQIIFHPSAQKELLRIPKDMRLRILDAIKELDGCNHPLEHRHVRKLLGKGRQDYRLRVGNYRVKFSIDSGMIVITHVEHRQAGY